MMGADQCLNDLGTSAFRFCLKHSALLQFRGNKCITFGKEALRIERFVEWDKSLKEHFQKFFFLVNILNKFQVTAVSPCSIVACILNHNYAQYFVRRSVSITARALTNVDRTPGNLLIYFWGDWNMGVEASKKHTQQVEIYFSWFQMRD